MKYIEKGEVKTEPGVHEKKARFELSQPKGGQMKESVLRWFLVFSLAAVFSFAAAPVFAQSEGDDFLEEDMLNAFGISDEFILQIPASAFTPTFNTVTWQTDNYGYRYATSCPSSMECFSAPVSLPSGALITRIALWANDLDSECNICAYLRRYKGGYTGVSPSWENIKLIDLPPPSAGVLYLCSSNTGCTHYSYTLTTPHTVNNDVFDGGGHYNIVIRQGKCISNLGFKAVDIWYKLQISPAPGTATFSDVPVGSFWHRYVEAMARSGITTGYEDPDNTYGPDDFVTRGQMAAFFSRALGLHWPH